MELNRIHNIDCLMGLSLIDDGAVDLIVTDPPYRCTSRGSSGTMGGYWKGDLAKRGSIFENNNISCKDYFSEFYRVLAADAHLYIMTNDKNLKEMLTEGEKAGFHFVTLITWDKVSPISGKYYMKRSEHVLLFRKGRDKRINDCGTQNILRFPIKKLKGPDGKNLHDTEKPVDLMRVFISNSSDEGQVVLDPFMGIGATAVACVEEGRNFIGFEIDEGYTQIANQRAEEARINRML